ncbi:STAS domain-containing protein [Streptomyces sp. NPDC048383]|uniref:STAS domain-containing protein n=1 Tax=Streptomyces sp. NPDC048383 TaxID=3155386 RepID=UPI00342623E3
MAVHAFTSHAVVESGAARVTLVGELDWDTAPYLRNAVVLCLAEEPTSVRVDLTDVSFCDCAGLGALLAARVSALRAGADFVVQGIGSQVALLLSLTGTGDILTEGNTHPGTKLNLDHCASGAVATRRDVQPAEITESLLRNLLA